MKLQWDQHKYGTGFARIDRQHKELFDGVNGLLLFLKQSSAAQDEINQAKILEMLQFLGEYAQTHFHDEEELFERYYHPMKEVNKDAHRLFLENYARYQEKLRTKLRKEQLTRSVLIQLHIFLQSWLVKHILKVDTALRDCAQEVVEQESAESEEADSTGVFSRFLSLFRA